MHVCATSALSGKGLILLIKNGTIGTAVTSLNGVNQKNTHPMDFVVSFVIHGTSCRTGL